MAQGGAAPNGSWAKDSPGEQRRNANLWRLITGPAGSKSLSRRGGALLFGFGIVLAAINAHMLINEHKFYMKAMFGMPLGLVFGLYTLVVGPAIDPRTGDTAAWAKVGYGVAAVAGLLLAMLALVLVAPW
jgi:hypothetical protein